MEETEAICRRLYDGFAGRDPEAMMEVMADDFVGRVSKGMPLGVGGVHRGAKAMFIEVWGPIFGAYEMNVEVESMWACDEDTVVVIGNYRGVERSSRSRVDARFAHLLRVRHGRICSLEQITDTQSWSTVSGVAPRAPASVALAVMGSEP